MTAHGARVSSLFLSQKGRTVSAGGRRYILVPVFRPCGEVCRLHTEAKRRRADCAVADKISLQTARVEQSGPKGRPAEISVRTTSPRRYGVIPQGLEVYRLGAVRGVAYWTHPPSRTCTVDAAPYGDEVLPPKGEPYPETLTTADNEKDNIHRNLVFEVVGGGGERGCRGERRRCRPVAPPLSPTPNGQT